MNQAHKLFFNFHDYDKEIESKMISQKIPSSFLIEALCRLLAESGTSSYDIQRTQDLFSNYLSGTSFDREKPHYLSHPIRVTASYLICSGNFNYDAASLGLCHNLKEKSGNSFRTSIPEYYLSRTNKDKIEVLTIDRDQEKDKAYLDQFYEKIAVDNSLLLLKALDKLDNTLIWPMHDLEKYHADIVLEQVCPRIRTSYPRLSEYLTGLTKFVVTPEAQKKFRAYETSSDFMQKVQHYHEVKSL